MTTTTQWTDAVEPILLLCCLVIRPTPVEDAALRGWAPPNRVCEEAHSAAYRYRAQVRAECDNGNERAGRLLPDADKRLYIWWELWWVAWKPATPTVRLEHAGNVIAAVGWENWCRQQWPCPVGPFEGEK